MIWLVILILITLCFCVVLLFGAPYLPTLKPQIKGIIDLAELQTGDTVLELGCGDGRVLIAMARAGINSVGYELNPILAFIAWLRTRRYRGKIKVVWGNFWNKSWPPTDVIFVFLLDRYMEKLDKKCIQYVHKPVKVISFAFKIPNRKPDRQFNGLYLYKYS